MKQFDRTSIRLSLDKLPQIPIKKNYDFYKHSGNLWNSKYLSSPKISKYYIEPNETYLTGPLGPTNLSLIESTERAQRFEDKAAKSKIESRQRLLDRKIERQKIQAKSKQLSGDFTSIIKPRLNSTPRRPFTQTFGVNQVQVMLNRFKSLSTKEKDSKLEPILLTQQNYSADCAIQKEHDGRFSDREKTVRMSRIVEKRNDKKQGINTKRTSEDSKDAKDKYKKLIIKIDKVKVQEILEELEEFEKQYAERLSFRM